MSKSLKIYITGFIAVLGVMLYLEYTKPKPINWTKTYSVKDKIPFGTYIINKEIQKLNPEKDISLVETTPYAFLSENETENSVYILINHNVNLSEQDEYELLDFVGRGNDVFIISESISPVIKKELGIEIAHDFNLETNALSMFLVNPVFKDKNYKYFNTLDYTYFSTLPDSAIVLGEVKTLEKEQVNFIKKDYGKGNFYLHLFPEAYSNYRMLNDSVYEYAVNSFNYLNKQNILWEENRKSVKALNESLLMHIFNNPPLHWAWIILLTSVLFYCIFFGKRLQRIIPEIKPLENRTLEFVRTIGNLYYNNNTPENIIHKKIIYFKHFVKERYFLNTEKIDEEFSKQLSLKAGVARELTDKIVFLIQKNTESNTHTEKELTEINEIIDLFYKKVKY